MCLITKTTLSTKPLALKAVTPTGTYNIINSGYGDQRSFIIHYIFIECLPTVSQTLFQVLGAGCIPLKKSDKVSIFMKFTATNTTYMHIGQNVLLNFPLTCYGTPDELFGQPTIYIYTHMYSVCAYVHVCICAYLCTYIHAYITLIYACITHKKSAVQLSKF